MNKTTEVLKLAKEAGFEVVDGELRLYFDGSNALLKPNRMGTVVDGLKEFAALVRAEYEAPLKLAEEALVYHTQQTRPIQKTDEALAAIREVLAEQEKQEPASNKYNHKRVGWELERTAMGDSYYGNALYSAMDLHFLNKREKDCLHRYMHGSETPNDRFVLQDIANKVYFEPEAEPEAEPVKQEPVAVISESAIGLVKLHSNGACLPFGTQLYAAPVERQWVDLTDDEMWDVFISKDWTGEPLQLMSAVIAAFKEENK